MEHPCHRCGSAVSDSSPFCPECGVPQVRFSPDEAASEKVTVQETAGTSPSIPPLIQPGSWHETDRRVAGRERVIAVRAALNAAVIAAILSLLPAGFIIGMPLGGFLTVLFYRRRSWRAEPSPGSGFRLGALAGAFASVIFGIIVAAGLAVSNHAAEFRGQILERFRIAESHYTDPQQRQMIEYLMTPQGMTLAIIMGAVFLAIIFVVLSGLGGMISALLLRRKGPRG